MQCIKTEDKRRKEGQKEEKETKARALQVILYGQPLDFGGEERARRTEGGTPDYSQI